MALTKVRAKVRAKSDLYQLNQVADSGGDGDAVAVHLLRGVHSHHDRLPGPPPIKVMSLIAAYGPHHDRLQRRLWAFSKL